MEHNMVFIQLQLPGLIRGELGVLLAGIVLTYRLIFPLPLMAGGCSAWSDILEILEEKTASNPAGELHFSKFAILRGSGSIHWGSASSLPV